MKDTGRTNHAIGNTKHKLNKFDPKTLPMTIPKCPFLTKRIVVINSGKDVPNATKNIDKNILETPNIIAMETIELTKNLELKINRIKDNTNNPMAADREVDGGASSPCFATEFNKYN